MQRPFKRACPVLDQSVQELPPTALMHGRGIGAANILGSAYSAWRCESRMAVYRSISFRQRDTTAEHHRIPNVPDRRRVCNAAGDENEPADARISAASAWLPARVCRSGCRPSGWPDLIWLTSRIFISALHMGYCDLHLPLSAMQVSDLSGIAIRSAWPGAILRE